jgi:hypothetical protein
VCATTLGLSANCARAILSLVAFISGQSCRVHAVFTVEQAVKSARLLRTSPALTTSSVSVALGGYSWRRGASPAGCWLAMLCTCC